MDVSVVVPAHNEEGNLRRLVDRVQSDLADANFEHGLELVLVDDNSTDETGAICDELAAANDYSHVVARSIRSVRLR